MNRVPDERDMDQVVRSWMREDEEHPADRNRQVGRIMGRVDETHQRRGAWRFLPFGRGAKRIDEHDEELYVGAGHAVAMRRGVSSAMALAAVAVLIVIGAAFVTLIPRYAEVSPGAARSPGPTIHPDDVAFLDRFDGTWSGAGTTLNDVSAVYAEDAVHTTLWLDGVERFTGWLEIWERIKESERVAGSRNWIRLPDADGGEHRYLTVTENLGGIACVFWIRDELITRHDCILPSTSYSPAMPMYEPAAEGWFETREAIFEDFTPGWGSKDRTLIEATTSPEIVHHVAYDYQESTLTGIDQYMSVMGQGEPQQLADPVPLPAPEGDHRWTDFSGVGGGSLCTFWERDGRIIRHDCIVPTSW